MEGFVDQYELSEARAGGRRAGELTLELLHYPERASADVFRYGSQTLFLDDCVAWLRAQAPNSFHAVLTDPPYGLVEYKSEEQRKLRTGRGGVWRIPPTFDGSNRAPLPRFTTLSSDERRDLVDFFTRWGEALLPVLRPGAHVIAAGNPLVSPLVAFGLEAAGFERRGEIARLIRTFRGGDRPKGAHQEFPDVSSMPRSCWEPWGLYRKPMDQKTLAENLRLWGTGGLRRMSSETPFLDVIQSRPAPDREREIAPHPSIKPQAFLRTLVRALLPVGDGVILDPFAGSGTTLAACEASGVTGVGVEIDQIYFEMAKKAVPDLAAIP